MALTDGTFTARHVLRLGGTRYDVGDEIPGAVFSDDAQVARYIRNGHVDVGSPEGGGGLPANLGGGGHDETFVSDDDSVAFGKVLDAGDGTSYAKVSAGREGSFAGGYAEKTGGTDGYALLEADSGNFESAGMFASGHAKSEGSGYAKVQAQRSGAMATGYAFSSGNGAGMAAIQSGRGGIASGYAYQRNNTGVGAGWAGSYIWADGYACFANGVAKAMDNGTYAGIISRGHGSQAHAYAIGTTAGEGAYVQADGRGAKAFGHARGNTRIAAPEDGGFAGGAALGTNGGTGNILASDLGSFAFGYASADAAGTALIEAVRKGSLAFGFANEGESIVAGGASDVAGQENFVQFGPGTNEEPNTVAIGTGPRLKGTVGAPGVPRNGDIWVTAGGDVVIQSGGVAVTIA